MWSFVGSKAQVVWLWIVLCRRTRQVVAWHWGERDALVCRKLWQKIPTCYKHALCYSDLWRAYQEVLPPEQHQACGKQEGQTNHVERFNCTARQRVPRLVRKTLCFSKILFMHLVHFRHFLIQYNLNILHNFTST